MLKKILYGLGILIVIIIAAGILLPIIFKDDIIQIAKDEASNNLNAVVDFGEFNLTIFKSFPDFTLEITDIKVSGVETFEGIDLADIGAFEVTVDLMSVISGGKIEVKSFGLVRPKLNVIVLKDGTANYDIAKGSDSEEKEESDESDEPTKFSLAVNNYYIEEAHIVYDDAQGNIYAELVNFTHRGTGDFTQDIFLLETTTTADAITVSEGGVKYLNKVETEIKFDLDMDLPNAKYTFNENSIRLNQLTLGFDGFVAMPGDDIDMDLSFHTEKTEFKSILSLVPAVYKTDFESVETKGKLALEGMAKGTYTETSLPQLDIKLVVEDGYFHYPDLPESVENIQVDLKIQNPGGSEDLTVIDLNQFHMELAKNPVDFQMHLKTPISDPYIDATVKSQLNLESLKDVIPMEEGQSYSGIVTADVNLKGNQSSIDNEEYEKFQAAGKVSLLGLDYKDPELPYDMNIKAAYLNFSPQFVELSKFEMLIGKSDINANGKIENFIAYYLSDDPLTGSFNMTSSLMDLNEFMEDSGEETEEAPTEGEEEELSVIEVPGNINFTANSSIGKLLYDNMEMTNVKGGLVIKDQKIILQQLAMNTLDGSLVVSGAYATLIKDRPTVDFNLDISGFDVQKTYQTFNTVQKMAPIAKRANGTFSTTMQLKTDLDAKMEPILNSMNGKGRLRTHKVAITNDDGVLAKVGNVLKTDQFKRMDMSNVNISYKFKDGRVEVDPFDFKVGSGDGKLSGSSGFDETIDYDMNLNVPTADLGGAANSAISALVSQANKSGLNLNAPDRVKVDIDITGTMDDPKIAPRWAGTEGGSPIENVKEQVKEELNKKKEEVEQKVKEEVDEAKAKAEEEARKKKEAAQKKIMDEAKQKAQMTRNNAKKAAEKVKKEGYDKAAKIESEAKNPIAKKAAKVSADKVRKESDKKHDDIIKEGDVNAEKIMEEARKKAAALD